MRFLILVALALALTGCGPRGIRWPVAVVTENWAGENSVICMAKDCTVLCSSFEVGAAKCAYGAEAVGE